MNDTAVAMHPDAQIVTSVKHWTDRLFFIPPDKAAKPEVPLW